MASFGYIESAFKLRYMGIGLVWAWLYCSYSTSALFSERQGQSINADASWLASAAAVVIVFLIGGAVLSRIPRASSLWLPLRLGAPLLMAVGTMLSYLGVGVPMLSGAGGLLTGIGYALLSLLWAQALMALDIEELEVAIPLSSVIIVPCGVVFPHLQGPAGLMATMFLPLASGVLLLLCVRGGETRVRFEDVACKEEPFCGEPHIDEGSGGRSPIERVWRFYLLRVMLVLGVLYMSVGWLSSLAETRDGLHALIDFDVAMLLSSLASVALGVAIVFFSKKVSFSGLFRWAVPFTVATLVLREMPGLWPGFAASAISATLDSLIQVLVYLFALTLAKQGKVPAVLGVGLLNGAVQLGVLVGNIGGEACVAAGVSLTTVGLLLVCLVSFAGIVAPSGKPIEDGEQLSGTNAVERALMEGCLRLQERFSLSDRETEIAFLLAQGRSRPYIREKLFISKNTVATHIKHIYQKLDIHSKEDLIDLVTAAASQD
ncbi:response regulator transcription factor [uncultured Adlercreutzia sp.]|uniref:response regulator transcription factor n=1 Tax=uncultured Adlercreutzia sp. TaxID=875803 RepID=UPI002674BDE5|nr:helix-turn-helix transcriptional regulator [uncultured Adlercreutzia sp.]